LSTQSIAAALARFHAALDEAGDHEWRPGTSDPQNIYAMMGTRPDRKDDPKVGRMESPQHAARMIGLHNAELARRRIALRLRGVRDVTGVQFGDGNSQTNVF
jgi:hypothetical protein